MDREAVWGEGVFASLDESLEGDLHGKWVLSSANATSGVMVSASPAMAVICRSPAQARNLLTEHTVEQFDRPLRPKPKPARRAPEGQVARAPTTAGDHLHGWSAIADHFGSGAGAVRRIHRRDRLPV